MPNIISPTSGAGQPLAPEAALVRLRQYGERTGSTWSTATYDSGTERALHQIAQTLAGEVDRLRLRVDEVERAYTFDTAALKRRVAELEAEAYRLTFPPESPFRHELESPLHENACAHMAPGCPCDDNDNAPEVTA